MSEHRYRVVAERSEDWWAISVPGLSGVFSQARRLDQVDAMAREAIALMLDVDETAVAVTIDPTLPPRTAAAVSEALSRRQARRDAEAREQEALRQAAGALAADGFTQREAGLVLGLTHQRISQILGESGSAGAAA